MSYQITFTLLGLPRTANSLDRRHWSVLSRERRKWKDLVWRATLTNPPRFPLQKARVVLTRFSSVEPDYDGLASSFKACVDGLVEARILLDDKVSVIGQPEYRWEKTSPGKGRVQIEVYEI